MNAGSPARQAMKLTIVIGVILLVAVGFVGYKLGYQAAGREPIAIAARNSCISNLRRIDGGKMFAAQKLGLQPHETVPLEAMAVDKAWPYKCPAGGVYIIGTLEELPICSIPGHRLGP